MVRQSHDRLKLIPLDHEEERDAALSLHEDVVDKTGSLLALAADAPDLETVQWRMTSMFNVEGPAILLSSTHKAKGKEYDRVFLLVSTYNPERNLEEKNLWYVAVTRCKAELYLIPRVTLQDRGIKSETLLRALAYGRGERVIEAEPMEPERYGGREDRDPDRGHGWDAWVDMEMPEWEPW